MSRAATHALIGATGGALALPYLAGLAPVGAPLVLGASALLALWPDIDEPQSWIGRRVRRALSIAGALGGLAHAWVSPASYIDLVALLAEASVVPAPVLRLIALLLGACGGALVGALLGYLILLAIRALAGGHRAGTHSLVTSGALLGIALLGMISDSTLVSGAALALLWGQLLHLIGDLVTPGGVELYHPLSTARIRLLPRPVAVYGEPLIIVVAVLVLAAHTLVQGRIG